MAKQQFNIYVSDTFKQTVQNAAADQGVSAGEVIERQFAVTPDSGIANLADAAAALVNALPEEVSGKIYSMVEETQYPLLAYILSYLELMVERGEISYISPSYIDMDGMSSLHVSRPTLQQTICEWCEKPFMPERRGQRYCPDTTDGSLSCGKQAFLKQMKEWNEQRDQARRAFVKSTGITPFSPRVGGGV